MLQELPSQGMLWSRNRGLQQWRDREKQKRRGRGRETREGIPQPSWPQPAKPCSSMQGTATFMWVNWHLTGGETEAQRNSDMSHKEKKKKKETHARVTVQLMILQFLCWQSPKQHPWSLSIKLDYGMILANYMLLSSKQLSCYKGCSCNGQTLFL